MLEPKSITEFNEMDFVFFFFFYEHNSLSLWQPMYHQVVGTTEWISRKAASVFMNLLVTLGHFGAL